MGGRRVTARWMTEDRWEHGSYPALSDPEPLEGEESVAGFAKGLGAMKVGSGRIALGRLIAQGLRAHGWRRLWVPTYYCQDVIDYLATTGITLARYPCAPCGVAVVPKAVPGDVLLRVNLFGWGLPPLASPFQGEVVEDYTHDPLAGGRSDADFAFASLRKVLPVADGALLWSPKGHDLPSAPPLSAAHDRAVMTRIAAMALKRAYLAGVGRREDKEIVRRLELESEAALLAGEDAALSRWSEIALQNLSLGREAAARRANLAVLRSELGGGALLRLAGPADCHAPLMAVLRLPDVSLRDALRAKLVERSIYPAVLWPVAPSPDPAFTEAADHAATSLMLHIDRRYGAPDMVRLAQHIRDSAMDIH